jgi:general secretion pathway protein L
MALARQKRIDALARFTELTDQVTTQARQARKLRNELDTSVTAANFLAERRAQQPTMLELLDDLTRRIPDNTSLDRLSINEGQVELVGQSQQAPALVALLQQSALLKTPALAGAVQADPRTGRDRFTLTATVAGSAQEASDARSP